MSALGHKRTFAVQNGMSALPSRADICSATRDVCFGPKADVENGVASPINKPTYSQGQDWGDTEVFSDQGDSSAPPARLLGDGP